MKEMEILEDTENSLKPYKIVKSNEEILALARRFLPDLSAEITAKQLSDDYLHGSYGNRWHATDDL